MSTVIGDERTPPFFWLTPQATRLIRDSARPGDPALSYLLAVYMALAELANEARVRSDIGQSSSGFVAERKAIAARSGASVRTVVSATEALARMGLVRIEERRVGADWHLPNAYVLTEPEVAPGARGTAPGAGGVLHGVQGTTQEEDQEEVPGKVAPDATQGIFDFWVERRKKPQHRLTPKRRQKVSARLKEGFTARELCEAIAGIAYSKHHMGENDRQETYDDLELICRNPENVEKFRDLYRTRRGKDGSVGQDANERRRQQRREQGLES